MTSLRLRTEFVTDPDVQQRMLATIDEIQTMTEATIAFARGEATIEETRTVDLNALVGSLCDDLADMEQPVTYQDGEKSTYRCRPDSLRRAIRNIIENAVRYGSEARVQLRHHAQSVDIIVEDDGPGIPEAMHEKCLRRSIVSKPPETARPVALAWGWPLQGRSSGITAVTSCLRTAIRISRS